MYKLLHIPTGNYVKNSEGKDLTYTTLPEDSFDRADLLRGIILGVLKHSYYSNPNKEIVEMAYGSTHTFSEFIFIEIT